MTVTILLIEDNPITTKLVKFTLERASYIVRDAADGTTGLRLFRELRPHLVLLDMLLPDLDGFELFARLRAEPGGAETPILAFSGMLTDRDEARMTEAGFDDVVSKPIEPSRLVQVVRAYAPLDDVSTPLPAPGEQKTIVIADDDSVQRKMVAARLRRAGFTVAVAADGEEALARARELEPYAIVSDVLMPKLDGFGLCMAIRNDPRLASLPVLLISNSYLESEDKALARQAGADELLVRTPDLTDVIAVLKSDLTRRGPAPRLTPVPEDPELERQRIQRMMSQLERQVVAQSGLRQRCALLSAELSVLSGISEAVATEEELEDTLRQILSSCFDAGGISMGTLYLREEGRVRGMHFGALQSWTEADIAAFFGAGELLDTAISTQTLVCVPSERHPAARYRTLTERTGARTLVVAPLGYKGESIGALVAMSRTADVMPSDTISFVQAVASQISLALALARAFHAKADSEREARGNAKVLRSILDSMAEGVIVTNEAGNVSHWNQAAASILKRPVGNDALGGADTPLVRGLRGERIDHGEMAVSSADDPEPRWLSVNARPLEDDHVARGGVAVFRDVTEEKAAAARMHVNERMASLGTLAAGVGHEINNPLMAVLGNLDMAITDLRQLQRTSLGGPLLGEALEELADAREAAERVRNIVRDLKLFSRQEGEEVRGEVDVQRTLESSIRMAANEIKHRAKLVRDFAPVPPAHASESRLGQVFLNLIINAVQAIPEGRASENEIEVRTRVADDGRVVVSVRDTGVGMSPETVAKIFVPFFTTKPIGVGTGLGLSICHQIVTALGGELAVDTKLGAGTTFFVLLPAAHAAVEDADGNAPAFVSSRRGRVLVIDDEPIVASTVRRALEREHDTTCLTSSREAARMVGGGARFDVILCDLMMPDLTGVDLYAELARSAPDQAARMIFLTGGAFTPQARRFLEGTRNVHIEKPIAPDALRTLVAKRICALDEE